MSDYSRVFNKNTGDTVNASDFNTEFESIATASATKANKISGATNDNPVVMDANGDIKDGLTAMIDLVYPVGSIYTSTASTNPGTLFGVGTWVATGEGRVLVGEGTGGGATYTAAATGGSKDAVLVSHSHGGSTGVDVANHTHNISVEYGGSNGHVKVASSDGTGTAGTIATAGVNNTHTHAITTDTQGTSATDANMPPYLVVYIWERTA
jgi:hypothetical protein